MTLTLNQLEQHPFKAADFHRGWVWDDNHVQSLLVSIARSFPVGAVMLMETDGEVRFETRPVEGINPDSVTKEPEQWRPISLAA